MFHVLGGRLHIQGYDSESPHAKQRPLRVVLQTLATQLKGVLNLHASSEVRDLFGLASVASHRQSALGFAQHLPCTRVEVCASTKLAEKQFDLLLRLRGVMSKGDTEKLENRILR